MMQRSLDALFTVGIREVIVVTGFEQAQLETAMHRMNPGVTLHFIHNAQYATTNNAYSLLLAEKAIYGRKFMLLDSDLLYDTEILEKLLATQGSSIALRRAVDLGSEEVKLALNAHMQVFQIGKEVAIDCAAGESVGTTVQSQPNPPRVATATGP